MITPENLEVADKSVEQLENGVRISPAILSSMQPKDLSLRDVLEYCLRTNDDAGWKEFFRRIRPTIDGTLAKRLRSWWRSYQHLVEDLRQEVHVKLLNNDARILRNLNCDTDEQLFKYIAMTAGSVAEDYRRKEQKIHQRTVSMSDEAFREPPAQELLHSRAEIQQVWDLVEECLDKMECGEQDRAIFYFFYKDGYSVPEIGRLPTIQEPTRKVENILLRLIRRVRSELKPHDRGRGSGA